MVPQVRYSNKLRRSPRRSRLWRSLMLLALPIVVPCLWLSYREIRAAVSPPQAMLVLGGNTNREKFAAVLAQEHPTLPIWISSGSNPEYTEWLFSSAGIDPSRVHIDRRAVDTVTNFTTLADQLKDRGISTVYLITSDYHMPRARVIGEIVFASRGISLKPMPVPSTETEPFVKTIRDAARSLLWLTTGDTGERFSRKGMDN
jgi:uncharacterized SAM-binding protein YcdF (DUF218 family)